MTRKSRTTRLAAVSAVVAFVTAISLTGCSPGGSSNSAGGSSDKVTVTLSGPNQFNTDTKSFGPAWDKLVAGFEKANPNITLKTNVLPIASWAQVSNTQLTAGTAPELIFNQTTHKADQVHNLDSYLEKPNPFIKGNKKWIDAFDSKYFAGPKHLGINGNGHHEWIPFNLVGVALYYNKDVLEKANVSTSSLQNFDSFINSCVKIKKAGFAPVATDNGSLTQGWEMVAISSTMFTQKVNQINQFDAQGNPGKADPITGKSIAKAVLTGQADATKEPVLASALQLLNKFNDACATPNWSGVTGSGAFTGGGDFLGGKAAMAWGTNFASTNLSSNTFPYGTTTFPTVSKSDSQYASGKPAQFGVTTGGTSYMIPAYIKGKQLEAAVKFLQYVSSPNIQPWLDKTGSIPAVKGLQAPAGLGAFLDGTWGTTPLEGQGAALVQIPKALTSKNPYEAYLLGATSLDSTLATIQKNNVIWAHEQVADNGWSGAWTKQ